MMSPTCTYIKIKGVNIQISSVRVSSTGGGGGVGEASPLIIF